VVSELLARSRTGTAPNLPPGVSTGTAEKGLKQTVQNVRRRVEAGAIAEALDATNWNRKAAAANLRISYKALLYKIKEFQLCAPASRVTGELNESDQLALSEAIFLTARWYVDEVTGRVPGMLRKQAEQTPENGCTKLIDFQPFSNR